MRWDLRARARASSHELALALILPANLKTAKVGDVVEALQQDGEQVAVVRLTVVNQVEGLDGVQSLLVRNTSRTLQNVDEIKRMRQKFVADNAAEVSKSELPSAPGDMICVYAEGSRDEMLGVLQGLQNESHIREAELTNTISFTTLEEYASRAVPANKQSNGPDCRERANCERARRSSVASGPARSLPSVCLLRPSTRSFRPGERSDHQGDRLNPRRWPGWSRQSFRAELRRACTQVGLDGQSGKKGADSTKPGANKAARRGGRSRAGIPQVAKQDDRSRLRDSKEVAGNQKSFQIFFVITDQPLGQSTRPRSRLPPSAAKHRRCVQGSSAAGQGRRGAPAKSAPANPAP